MQQHAAALGEQLVASAITKGALSIVVAVVDAPVGSLRDIAGPIDKKLGPSVVVLGTSAEGKVGVLAFCSPEAIAAGYSAGAIVGELCGQLGGKGGGKPDFAQGGGKDATNLTAVLKTFLDKIK
jgi:alanyl-tRNA synthetase